MTEIENLKKELGDIIRYVFNAVEERSRIAVYPDLTGDSHLKWTPSRHG